MSKVKRCPRCRRRLLGGLNHPVAASGTLQELLESAGLRTYGLRDWRLVHHGAAVTMHITCRCGYQLSTNLRSTPRGLNSATPTQTNAATLRSLSFRFSARP